MASQIRDGYAAPVDCESTFADNTREVESSVGRRIFGDRGAHSTPNPSDLLPWTPESVICTSDSAHGTPQGAPQGTPQRSFVQVDTLSLIQALGFTEFEL